MKALYILFVVAMSARAAGVAYAQEFPSKPVRYIVPSAPGGSSDTLARVVALRLADALKQQVVIDNRAGATGIIGAEIVARAAPDGHTLYMGTTGHLSVNPALYPKLPFDIERDFIALTEVVWLQIGRAHV